VSRQLPRPLRFGYSTETPHSTATQAVTLSHVVSGGLPTTSCPYNFDRSKMSTLSAATTQRPDESSSTPTYPNGEPILYTRQLPAELTGILEALDKHFINNDLFQPLLMHGAVLLPYASCAMAKLPSIPSLPQHFSPTRPSVGVWAHSRTRT